MVIATALGWGAAASIVLAIALAFVFGYSFTLGPVLRAGVGLRAALAVALAADTVSITVMELVDNGVLLVVPGAIDAGLADVLFWASLIVALAVRVRGDGPGQPLADRPRPRPRRRSPVPPLAHGGQGLRQMSMPLDSSVPVIVRGGAMRRTRSAPGSWSRFTCRSRSRPAAVTARAQRSGTGMAGSVRRDSGTARPISPRRSSLTVPDVDVHRGAVTRSPASQKREELAARGVAAQDDPVAGTGGADVLHAEVVLVGEEVRLPVVDVARRRGWSRRRACPCRIALSQCSTRIRRPSAGLWAAATSPAARMCGSAVRRCSSVSTAAPPSSSPAGATPTAMTTVSASTRSPPAVTTRPRRDLSTARTSAPVRRSTPCRRCRSRKWRPSVSPRTRCSGQRRVLQHGDGPARPARGRGDLQADPAGADDHPPLVGGQRLAQPVGVLPGTQRAHLGQVRAGDRQPARAGAGRDDEVLVRDSAAGRGEDPAADAGPRRSPGCRAGGRRRARRTSRARGPAARRPCPAGGPSDSAGRSYGGSASSPISVIGAA